MLLDIRFIGNKFQGPRNFCTCMTDHFAIISLLEFFFSGYNFGRCPVLKQYPFCSVAVGTFQPYPWKFRRGWSFSSNYTHDTYSTICSGFRYLKHKQRDWIIFHRQSGGSRSGSPHSIPERMACQDGFKALRVQRLLEPGFVRCPWRIDESLTSDNAWDGMGVTHLMVDGSYKNEENRKRFARETVLFTASKLCQCLIWSQHYVSILTIYFTLTLFPHDGKTHTHIYINI